MRRTTLIDRVKSELERAQTGQELQISEKMWLAALNLDTEVPDGMTLFTRFTADRSLVGKGRLLLSGATALTEQVMDLITRIGDQENTVQEMELARNFASIASRQILREGDICPIAHTLVVRAFEINPELFPEDLHADLYEKGIRVAPRHEGDNQIGGSHERK